MHAEELGRLLAGHSVFADCTNDELSQLILRGQFVTFKKGEHLIRQGDAGDKLYIILSGMVRVSMVASNGHEIVLDYAETGHVLGEVAFLDGGERTANVEALGEVDTLCLGRGAFDDIAARHPAFPLRVMQALARRLRQTNAMIEADRAYTSGPRLARHLLRLMVTGAEEGRLKLDLSQGELGSFVGLSREQVNRQLSAWSEDGLIALKQGRLKIIDRELLVELAEAEV